MDEVSQANLDGINLKNARSLYLPAFWPEKEHAPAFGTSAIWLSREVFEGLDRTRVSSLRFGILNPALQGAIADLTDFKNSFSNLEIEKKEVQDRIDVFKLDGEPELIEWPLKVNGQNIKVEVIKAHSWFGELIVLNNEQNPLILKATLNPSTVGVTNLFSGLTALKALIGYEIVELKDIQG